jgi:Ca2+-binding EF-hand superfamily protein
VSSRRREIQEGLTAADARLEGLMAKYDTDESGQLDPAQTSELMASFNNGQAPTQHEVDFVLKMADTSRTGGLSSRGELKRAVAVWKGLQRDMELIDGRFSVYDKNDSGVLEPAQVRTMLADLNEGVAPTKNEMSWILQTADSRGNGALDRDELHTAVVMWYARPGTRLHREQSTPAGDAVVGPHRAQAVGAGESACCVVS